MRIIPITLRQAKTFIEEHHRHNRPPVGHKWSIGLEKEGYLVGVAVASRPVARALDDGFTIEVSRTCTLGGKNANSMLYGAIWRCAKAMGYKRAVTYTQAEETGASLRAVGWLQAEQLSPRASWAASSVKLRSVRHAVGDGNVARVRWEIKCSPSE